MQSAQSPLSGVLG